MPIDVKRFLIGCDPGKTGALSLLDDEGNLIDLSDIPLNTWQGKKQIVFGKDGMPKEKYKEEWDYNGIGIKDLLERWKLIYGVDILWIEALRAGRNSSGHALLTLGFGAGLIRGAAIALGYTVYDVDPQRWKNAMKVTKDKKTSLKAVRDRWPGDKRFILEQHDDRAESVLIGLYGLRQ